MSTYPWTPGFIAGDRPRIVTSRFEFEDSHTLERSLEELRVLGVYAPP